MIQYTDQGSPNGGPRPKCGDLVNFFWLFLTNKHKKLFTHGFQLTHQIISMNCCENHQLLTIYLDVAVLSKVMPDINKSVWEFFQPCCVRRPLYIIGYAYFIAQKHWLNCFCKLNVYPAKTLNFTFQQHGCNKEGGEGTKALYALMWQLQNSWPSVFGVLS